MSAGALVSAVTGELIGKPGQVTTLVAQNPDRGFRFSSI
jgi:hypothetical protein